MFSDNGTAVWIGLNDLATNRNFKWVDGTTVTYTNWAPTEPNNFFGAPEDCVMMYTSGCAKSGWTCKEGMWNDATCDTTSVIAGFICKARKQLMSATPKPENVGCTLLPLFVLFGCFHPSYMYMLYNFINTTLAHLVQEQSILFSSLRLATAITAIFLYLVSRILGWMPKPIALKDLTVIWPRAIFNFWILSPFRYTQAFMSSFMEHKNDVFWIGLSDINVTGTYYWINGWAVSFTFWSASHTGNEQHSCVSMSNKHPRGLWENKNCSERHHYWCQYPRGNHTVPQTSVPTTTVKVSCPSDWVSYGSNCYKVFNPAIPSNRKTWMEARDYCRSIGSNLASIHSQAEDHFFSRTLLL
ncbi:hypothetical protein KUTeg_015151 [Tegillarca granosa]|uniref:C-type lectin domain-containing protein n=1 Tax=Tegillarca granosa TaxID=220873 RepID=A0ABQ9ESX9_TEGGR|nr:hypothetical protein KUTeg_015151 [Tegillarca granosa]